MLTTTKSRKSLPFARLVFRASCVLATAALSGCSHDDHDHASENPNAEACEHLQEGPAVPVSAAVTASTGAPPIAADHKRYDVSLAAAAGGKAGHVTFASGKAGEYTFFTSAAVMLQLSNATLVDVPAELSATSIPECTDVKGRHVFDLQVGTYVIKLSSPTIDQVSLVVEGGDAH